MPPAKKPPMRMCVGCRVMKPKREIMRVVRSPQGEVALDFVGKMPGRGAYVCRDSACFARAKKVNALERALGHAIPDEVFDALSSQIQKNA
ncbi:MAG: YlxR family protein [Oscillospiraceae bacterium]|nr:YlxR family protein [Oscillospiraceae bacterium]